MRLQQTLLLLTFGLPCVFSTGASTAPRGVPKKEAFFKRNFKTISSIYNFTIYPNQLPIIAQATSPSIPQIANLFSSTVAGRIQDIGNFTNFRSSIEYFFGLAPIPREPLYQAFSAFDLVQFSSDCPSVASSTVYYTMSVADKTRPDFGRVVTYLKQSGFWHFDETGRVDYYDLNIPALQDFTNISDGADFSDELVQLGATKQLCISIQQVCTGANQQYQSSGSAPLSLNSLATSLGLSTDVVQGLDLLNLDPGALECFATLKAKRFGSFDKLWSDSVACRLIHVILAAVDPDEHCPHVGPTGGGKCVDFPYNERLFADIPLFGERYRFRCPRYDGL